IPGPPFDGVSNIILSRDGKRSAYIAQRGEFQCVVTDGTPGRDYDWIVPGLSFSPDSRHIVYVADHLLRGEAKQEFIVVDTTEGRPFRWVRGTPVFSIDSTRLAYIACSADPRFDAAEEIPTDPRLA